METEAAMTRRRGFTMVEMLVVIAVLAILALIALPTYTDKLIRDQIAEALPLTEIAKPPIAAAWKLGKPFLADNDAAGLPAPDKVVNNVVDRVTVEDGAIHIRFGNRAHSQLKGKILTVRPAVVEEAPVVPITWLCGTAAAPNQMIPVGVNRTNVPVRLLPIRCR